MDAIKCFYSNWVGIELWYYNNKKLSLLNKVTIITGSSKGIGFAIAKEFAENNGAIVIVCTRIL